MITDQYAVVFDTNSYRNLVLDQPIDGIQTFIAQLKKKEAAKNILPELIPVVGMEMLAHLADPDKELHYDACLKGLIGMANHCSDKEKMTLHLVPHTYIHLAQVFFDIIPSYARLISENMAGVVADFNDEYLKAVEGHRLKDTFNVLKDYIDREESRWIGEVLHCVEVVRAEVLKQQPSIDRKNLRAQMLAFIDSGLFVPTISMAIMYSIAQSLGVRMSGEEHVFKGSMLPQTFPLAVTFYQWICRRIVADDLNLHTKKSRQTRWNWRWDYEVSFLINDHRLKDRKVLLVTSDKDMTNMLGHYGYGERVMDLAAYLKMLEE